MSEPCAIGPVQFSRPRGAAENSFTKLGFWEYFVDFSQEKQQNTRFTKFSLVRTPEIYTKSDISGLAPIRRALIVGPFFTFLVLFFFSGFLGDTEIFLFSSSLGPESRKPLSTRRAGSQAKSEKQVNNHSLRIYPYPMVWPLPRPWSETMVSIPL